MGRRQQACTRSGGHRHRKRKRGHAVAESELAELSPQHQEGEQRVAAFEIKYYATRTNQPSLSDPVDTTTSQDR